MTRKSLTTFVFAISAVFLLVAALHSFPRLSTRLFINSSPAAGAPSNEFNFHGEYGLYIKQRGNEIEVNWITQQEDSGYLQVLGESALLFKQTTNKSRAHSVRFDLKRRHQYVLKYGGVGNSQDQNATAIYRIDKRKRSPAAFDQVDSIFVVGDVHGKFNELTQLLGNANLINSSLRWTGGRAHLVMLGDLFDRGPDVTRVLWFLYGLEAQARQQGGFVHIVLGNHEIMTFVNDLRYLSEKESLLATLHRTDYAKLFNIDESVLGQWLASKPGLIKINDILFAHGGVVPNYASYSIQAFNDSLFSFMHEPAFARLLDEPIDNTQFSSALRKNRLEFFFSPISPFWFRGYVESDTLEKYLDAVLKRYGAQLHVVAHTPVETIKTFYNGKVIATDLQNAATEMLLLVRHEKKRYKRFKRDLYGKVSEL
jgi:hypothetical protein